MSIKKQVQLNIINFFIFFFITLIFFHGGTAINVCSNNINLLKYEIEQHWRENARQTIINQINIFEKDIESGIVDPNSNESVSKWASLRFSGIRNGSSTSDGWVAEVGQEIFIDDQSPDCMKIFEGRERHFIDEPSIHVDPLKAEEVLDKIRSGNASTYGDDIWWNFDGEPEWIEYAYYPQAGGLDGELRTKLGIKNEKYRRFVFVMGTQSDEILSKYKSIQKQKVTIKYTYIAMGLIFILSMTIMIYVIFFDDNKRRG